MQSKRKPWYRYTSASFKIKTDTYCAVEIKATVLLVSKMVTYQSAVCSKGHVAELFYREKDAVTNTQTCCPARAAKLLLISSSIILEQPFLAILNSATTLGTL